MRDSEINRRELLERRRELGQNATEAERRLWQALRGKKRHGAKFYRQYSIGPYIVDFCCFALRLAVEIDGGIHTSRAAYDASRDAYLRSRGFRVLRFSNDDALGQTDDVVRVIDRACAENKTSPS